MDLDEHGGLLRRLIDLLETLLFKVENMTAQSDVDAATAAMGDATASLNADAPELETLLTSEVDTSALSAAIVPLQAAVAGISALASPPVTTATATSSTSTGTTTTVPPVSSAPTVGTGLPGDPVRPA
jgi:hypothetical protein